jgi:hypothetical protein
LYYQDRALFLAMLIREIANARKTARRRGQTLIVRPNVISDIDWPVRHPEIIESFPDVRFYGYTKDPFAFTRGINGEYPANYHLTFSRSETNESQAIGFLAQGHNITVIFDTKYTSHMKYPLPAEWKGFKVIDGDETDLQFLDPKGVVVGLSAKGFLRHPEFQRDGIMIRTDRHKVTPRVID